MKKSMASIQGLVAVWAKHLLPLAGLLIALLGQEKTALAVYKYCATYTPTFVDNNKGEDYLNVAAGTAAPMAYHTYEFWNSNGTQMIMSGTFDINGCATTNTSTGTGQFRVFPVVKRGSGTVTIRAKLLTETEAQTYAVFTLTNASSPGAGVTTFTLIMGNFMADFFRASAVGSAIPSDLLLAGSDFTIVAQADTDVECPGGATGCAGGTTLFLGHDANGVWHNQRKAVVAHELGHLAQGALFGFWSSPGASGDSDYTDVPNNSTYCSCWYVQSPTDQSHCITSREFLTAAFGEGYAHFFATRTLNNSADADAVFPYYKEELVRASSQLPTCGQPGGSCSFFVTPVAHNVITTHRWLETQCSTDMVSHRATEMDWLGLLYNLNDSQSYSGSDIKNIMLNSNACGASCTGSDSITWTKLNTSVNAQGGFTATKKAKFNDQSVAYGVKR